MIKSTFLLFLGLILPFYALADSAQNCQSTEAKCLFSHLHHDIPQINEPRWRNTAYRDLAESLAYSGDIDGAIALVHKIDNPDTQAMTIRAIGMVLAIHRDLDVPQYKAVFKKLDTIATIISNDGARDIAYTYIAMAQAFAGLDADATKTTNTMKNPALKYKAFGETAEIQAERGDYEAALKSVTLIDSVAFRNKSMSLTSDIFVKRKEYDKAFAMASQITNPTKKAAALQKILNAKIGLDEDQK